MSMLSLWRKFAAALLTLVLIGCGGGRGDSAPAPVGFAIAPGNGQATITWTQTPGVEYWVMYAATTTPIDIKNPPGGHAWVTNISSPYVLAGLANGVTYSFAMNGRTGGGKGGPQTASLSTVPRIAGSTWVAGTPSSLGSSDMRGVAIGTSSDSKVNYLAVGDGGALYKGLEGATQSLSGMVWTALAPSPAIATDFRAAIYAFGRFIALGANNGVNNIVSSSNLTSWTAATWTPPVAPASGALNAVASNGSRLLAVGDGGNAFTTTDGVTWTAVTTGVTANLVGVSHSSTVGWVAVGAGGTLITSTDLVTWNTRTTGVLTNLNGVAVTSGNILVAVGAGGVVLKSTDGISWAAQTSGTTNNLFALNTDSVQFLVVGAAGTVLTSLDGTSWSAITQTSATTDLLAITGSTTKYMVVARAGANMSSIN